jgi:hypothetical protein
MKKSKLMKSLMNAGTIGIAGMGASVGIASCTPENAETLNINGGGDINGRIGQSITTEKLDCTTATGSLVSDAFFSVSNLPAGLTIDSGTGIISGTPTKLESGEYTIVVTSAQHPKANGKINEPFQIGPVVPKSLIISGEQDINGNVNAPITTYKLNCQTDTGAVVGDAIYNMDPSTPLPNNLEINSDTGVISGIPTAEAATNTYTINVISNTYPGLSGSVNIDITIGAQIPKSLDIIGAVNITGNVNTQITNTSSLSCLTDTGASVENVFYSVLDLPNDLQIDPSSGIISGIPKTEGSGTYTINATADGLSGTIVKSYSISNPLPTDLVIVGAENINGNVNTAITAAPLYCQTNTGAVVGDAVYTILNKPS